MAEKTNANIGFEKQLWDAACVLWGHIPAAEYRKVNYSAHLPADLDNNPEKIGIHMKRKSVKWTLLFSKYRAFSDIK